MEFTGEAIAGNFPWPEGLLWPIWPSKQGQNGNFIPDEKTKMYVEERKTRKYAFYTSDPDAVYAVKEYDISLLEPQVAFPHLPSNVRGISTVGSIPIDQVVIGSCTNGRIEDLRIAAQILKGRKVAPFVRLIIIPATPVIYRQALEEGLFHIFLDSKGVISPRLPAALVSEDIWEF